MKPVDQKIISSGNGDCLRACVASLFETSLEEVPHFIEQDQWTISLIQFVESKGFVFNGSGYPTNGEIKDTTNGVDGFVIASGPSPNIDGCSHAVIYNIDGTLAHDPNPSRKGIKELECWYLIERPAPKAGKEE